jgi:hypothetical protein
MKARHLVTCALCCWLSAPSARAEERRVIVLMPRALESEVWPAGTQAVIAELAAVDYQVIVESSQAASLEALTKELRRAASSPSAAAALTVLRRDNTGIAYVYTQRDSQLMELQGPLTQGSVGEGALALRVTELVRTRDWQLPEPAPEAPSAPRVRKRAPEPRPRSALWLGLGPLFSSGTAAPLIAASFGLAVPLSRPLTLDATVNMSLLPLELSTEAGAVEINTRQLTAHLLLSLWRSSVVTVSGGPGGGVVWVQETAEAVPGYRARSDSAAVGLLTLRARAAIQTGGLTFVLIAEPGALLPAVSVRADQDELSRIGNPWVLLSGGLGWTL